MNMSSFEFNSDDFELLHRYNALPKRSHGIRFPQKQFIHEIHEKIPREIEGFYSKWNKDDKWSFN